MTQNLIGTMTTGEIMGGLALLAAGISTVVEIAPIKINPWTSLARAIGRAINGDVLKELENVKQNQRETQQRLDGHIRVDDERDADKHRERILQFNTELLRNIPHTREDFIEILVEIDKYERYCRDNPNYPNNRAVHAIANIGRVYDERLVKHDFLSEGTKPQ